LRWDNAVMVLGEIEGADVRSPITGPTQTANGCAPGHWRPGSFS